MCFARLLALAKRIAAQWDTLGRIGTHWDTDGWVRGHNFVCGIHTFQSYVTYESTHVRSAAV
jgi:hypothetical protein